MRARENLGESVVSLVPPGSATVFFYRKFMHISRVIASFIVISAWFKSDLLPEFCTFSVEYCPLVEKNSF